MTATERSPSLFVRPLGAVENNPTALKLILGGKLRELRVSAGLDPADVDARLGFSRSKTSRLELGRHGCKPADAEALLRLYGVEDEELVAEFQRLVAQSRRPDWWRSFSDVLSDFFTPLVALEGAAAIIRTYEPFYVPGLLQTPDYARAVIESGPARLLPHDVRRRVELRQERQRQLDLPGAPRLWAVLDESVLMRTVGGPRVMRAQLEHLAGMAERSHVTVQVAQLDITASVGVGTGVTYLRFALGDLKDAVYIEHLTDSTFSQKPQTVEQYRDMLDRLGACALTPKESLALLEERLRRL
ncbi:XRE family transcriptional regulator [Streptomyces sp. WAC05374]|uniref:helix-turn-helix domain-containing protein n=1 Tax=Streptomyces sp. WAC05374 TaxID=2487420 RepID=UPI000F882A8A|nr:helix-turn-helix transcriptional regulator [Streptomyces sp. WAC05374]RST05241.1 XRE family transcriptional regulator [Streptomyces sp. WAC05374]TDF54508.1 XRE family transcriptional regulator [Streptomyces sp. WAC05374]TDF56143.1 XRE family transcriptional regulator [Streptomyces sp. WAC05374]